MKGLTGREFRDYIKHIFGSTMDRYNVWKLWYIRTDLPMLPVDFDLFACLNTYINLNNNVSPMKDSLSDTTRSEYTEHIKLYVNFIKSLSSLTDFKYIIIDVSSDYSSLMELTAFLTDHTIVVVTGSGTDEDHTILNQTSKDEKELRKYIDYKGGYYPMTINFSAILNKCSIQISPLTGFFTPDYISEAIRRKLMRDYYSSNNLKVWKYNKGIAEVTSHRNKNNIHFIPVLQVRRNLHWCG